MAMDIARVQGVKRLVMAAEGAVAKVHNEVKDLKQDHTTQLTREDRLALQGDLDGIEDAVHIIKVKLGLLP